MTSLVTPGQGHQPYQIPLNEARLRLSQLIRLTELADQVTIITDAGRPVAALVPAVAARSNAETRSAAGRSEAVAAGWMRRLDTLRTQLGAQHAAELRALAGALGQAWKMLDRLRPPGTDPAVDELRAAHRHHLAG